MTPSVGYTEMKDSGTTWLGWIPAHWELSKIGALYSLRNERVSDKDYPPLSVTMKGILPQLATAAKTDDGDNRKLVRAGDFAINSRSDRRGSCGISPYDGSVSLINTILTPRGRMHPDYYNWLFHTSLFADEFYKWGHGIVDDLWTTRWQEMKRILVAVPPYEEQSGIAVYLDTQCAKIDEIIAEAKASIEDYKQWRASIIYEAVTKGLDPNVEEMKDSGIEWIGEIPKGWNTIRLKWLLSSPLQYGASETGVPYNSALPRYIRITDISMEGKLKNREILSLSEESATGYILNDEDILFARSGATVGKAFFYKKEYGRAAFAGYMIRAKINRNITLPQYVYFSTMSAGYERWKETTMTQATIQNISAARYNEYVIPVPSLKEQIEIVQFVERMNKKINELISDKSELIANLDSYKKSLIYEVVTGKRRVC